VLLDLNSRVSGLRNTGRIADDIVVREGRRCMLEHRGEGGGAKAQLAVFHMSGFGLQQLIAVVRRMREIHGKRDGEG